MKLRSLLLPAALGLLSLGCPGPLPGSIVEDGIGSGTPTYNHSTAAELRHWFSDTGGTSGVWTTQIGTFPYALVGTASGLRIQPVFSGGPGLDVPGPVSTSSQRDVETYGTYAYVCSRARGFQEGIEVVDLRDVPAKAPIVNIFQPQDGHPEAANLSIDTSRGLLFLQRGLGVEIWDLKADPVHPTFLARVAEGVPVSDLMAQGGRLYLAEGKAKGFSVWDVMDPAHPVRLSRWASQGFANSIWPREDGQVVGTLEETPDAPVRFWVMSASGTATEAGRWSLDGKTLATSIKLRKDHAYIAHREAGLVVLSLKDLNHPTLSSRFDGPSSTPDPALRATVDIQLVNEGDTSDVVVSDGGKGLLLVYSSGL